MKKFGWADGKQKGRVEKVKGLIREYSTRSGLEDGLKRLLRISEKQEKLAIGLMSGTSHDGIDAALVCIKGEGLRTEVDLLRHTHYPYSAVVKRQIEQVFDGCTEDICRMNFELGELFAEAALKCINESGISVDDLDFIASHGQTIYHVPPKGKTGGSTLQIGEADIIAERIGVVTISDFRKRDMAVAGHGAPLVPYADFLLFREEGKISAAQNLGGIANVTIVTEKIEEVMAFDTGPGNALLDETVRILSGGEKDFDTDGAWAATGAINHTLLDELMSHPYLKEAPPKSSGREAFGKSLARSTLTHDPTIAPEDLLATLTCFTAQSIHRAYTDFIFPRYRLDRIILSGGGCRNRHMLRLLNDFFEDIPVMRIDELGIPSHAKEAIAFALLGNETIAGMPGNLPTATGARKHVVLGKISL